MTWTGTALPIAAPAFTSPTMPSPRSKRFAQSLLVGLAAMAIAGPAAAETPLEVEYERVRTMMNTAIAEAAGAVTTSTTLPETTLPEAAFFNPLRLEADLSAVTTGEAEIKGAPLTAKEGIDASKGELLTVRRSAAFMSPWERTETFATGKVDAQTPVHWALHGYRLYVTPTPKNTTDLREKRNLTRIADDKYHSWSGAFRENNTYNAVRPVNYNDF